VGPPNRTGTPAFFRSCSAIFRIAISGCSKPGSLMRRPDSLRAHDQSSSACPAIPMCSFSHRRGVGGRTAICRGSPSTSFVTGTSTPVTRRLTQWRSRKPTKEWARSCMGGPIAIMCEYPVTLADFVSCFAPSSQWRWKKGKSVVWSRISSSPRFFLM
jgi:hypothetical protein